MIALYHQTKTPIGFWCKQGMNLKSLIQPSETLLVKLTRTKVVNTIPYRPVFTVPVCAPYIET